MTGPVLVELPPVSAASPYVRTLLESCTTGMHSQAPCTLGAEDARADQSAAIAIVAWEGAAHRQARIDVGLRVEGAPRWRSRFLSFSSEDPEAERWRTVGFAIATLVGEGFPEAQTPTKEQATVDQPPMPRDRPTTNAPPTATSPSTVPSPLSPDVQAAPADERGMQSSRFDGSFVVGRGASMFSAAEGGELRFSQLLGSERWLAEGALGCTVQMLGVDGISLVRPSASAGVGIALLRHGGLELALRVEGTVELFAVAGRDPRTGGSGQGESLRFGFRQGFEAAWMWAPHLGIVAGINAIEMTSSATIDAHGQAVARVTPFDFAGQVGLRTAFR